MQVSASEPEVHPYVESSPIARMEGFGVCEAPDLSKEIGVSLDTGISEASEAKPFVNHMLARSGVWRYAVRLRTGEHPPVVL